MNEAPDPEELARQGIEMLNAEGDARAAATAKTFFKPDEKVAFYGVRTSRVRQIESELFKTVRRAWTLPEAMEFCDILVRNPYLEAKALGLLLLARYKKSFRPGLLKTAKSWLSASHCGNWATTDSVCPWIIAPLLERFPDLVPELKRWTSSGSLWLRRAAAVSLIPLARRGKHLEAAYAVARSLLADNEDLIHKATGWLLREAGKTNSARLESFLLRQGSRIPRTTLRYAIERFPEAKRKSILRRTKETRSVNETDEHR